MLSSKDYNDILLQIKELEDKLWDAISYISSDYCKQCSDMYDKVKIYEKQIDTLKNQLKYHETID